MHNHALRPARDAGVAVGHGEGDHFVGARDDGGEAGPSFHLPLGDGFDDGWVVGAQVDEAVRHAQFPQGFEKGIAGRIPGFVVPSIVSTLKVGGIHIFFSPDSLTTNKNVHILTVIIILIIIVIIIIFRF